MHWFVRKSIKLNARHTHTHIHTYTHTHTHTHTHIGFVFVFSATPCATLAGANNIVDSNACGTDGSHNELCTFACGDGFGASGTSQYSCNTATGLWEDGSLVCAGPHIYNNICSSAGANHKNTLFFVMCSYTMCHFGGRQQHRRLECLWDCWITRRFVHFCL